MSCAHCDEAKGAWMAHGGGATFGVVGPGSKVAAAGPPPHPLDPQSFQGYSHFLGRPSEGQRSALGADPAVARQALTALYGLLPIQGVPSGQQIGNQSIPAGYTYLLQFIAHDLVDTTVPFWIAADSGVPSRNMRTDRLQLDTLYGGGPTTCPIAFKPAGPQPDFRTQLRLGRVSDADALGLTMSACPYRDLPRLALNRMPHPAAPSNVPTPSPSNFDEIWANTDPPSRADQNLDNAAQVFVADIRNDDTLTLTQIAVLFSILHNAIVAKLDNVIAEARFALARAAMIKIYHSVIREDLMPRLLRAEVLQELKDRPASSGDWLWDGRGIPLEFSHGAFRIGHAMVNASYVFNDQQTFGIADVIGGPIVGESVRDALPSFWIVAWSRFFQFAGMGPPNFSLRFFARKQMPLDFTGLMPKLDDNAPDNVSVRDWMSAAAARMWRPDALIAAVARHYPALKFVSPDEFRAWFGKLPGASAMAGFPDTIKKDPALLTDDLPLPLYTLLEAQFDTVAAGQRLGPLGSIIVGEVIFRCLANAEAIERTLLRDVERALGPDEWRSVDSIRTMPELIELARDWGGLADCRQIPFIA
jgi:hypothetical protein